MQPGLDFQTLLNIAFNGACEVFEAVAPVILGMIHSCVRMAQKISDILAVVGINADTQTAGYVYVLALNREFFGKVPFDALSNYRNIAGFLQTGEKYDKFITAQPGYGFL